MISGFLFAQSVAAAHVCPLAAPHAAAAGHVATSTQAPMPPSCAGMATPPDSTSTANACESHCSVGQSSDVQALAWVAALGLPQALRLRVPDRGVPDARAAIWFSSLRSAPPLSLLFGHFLI